jgi:peptide/nickel transport system permease protein
VDADRETVGEVLGSAPVPAPPTARRARGSDVVYESLRTLAANPLTLAGFVLVVILTVAAVLVEALPPITAAVLGHAWSILPYAPNSIGPLINSPPNAQHWFGTDELGRDVLSRVVAALPLDLGMGVAITVLSVGIGAGLGLVAGFWDESRLGRALSAVILRITDIFLAFPTLVLAIALTAILGKSINSPLTAVIVALTVTWWPYYVRIVRGEVLVIKHMGYIYAARIAGLSERRILVRHVLRNLLEPLTVYATLDVGTVIVTFSTIAFVGLISIPNLLEWGTMVATYQSNLPADYWLVLAPGLAIFVTVLALSLLGDGLRDVLDPRTRRAFAREAQTSTAPEPAAAMADVGE